MKTIICFLKWILFLLQRSLLIKFLQSFSLSLTSLEQRKNHLRIDTKVKDFVAAKIQLCVGWYCPWWEEWGTFYRQVLIIGQRHIQTQTYTKTVTPNRAQQPSLNNDFFLSNKNVISFIWHFLERRI